MSEFEAFSVAFLLLKDLSTNTTTKVFCLLKPSTRSLKFGILQFTLGRKGTYTAAVIIIMVFHSICYLSFLFMLKYLKIQ